MLRIENASISFNRVPLFNHLNIHVKTGELVCITGESGKGKSSLLNAILGFVPLAKGHIHVNGIELNEDNIDSIRKYIAWIPQELTLPYEWVRDMATAPFELKANKHLQYDENQLFAYFKELGLNENIYAQRTNEISGGQRQRLMIAIAAMLNKPLLIVDEPTSALDDINTKKVLKFFLKIAEEKRTTILTVSHDKRFAEGCHQIIQL